jgi:hypothetical protein
MWILLNDCFFSIVAKDCSRDELLVRARRKGDIGKLFPKAKVKRDPKADYLYRARVKKAVIVEAMKGEVDRITYGNFKSSVADPKLHAAYLRVWGNLGPLQENWDEWPMFREF